jgi:hypothetical protein
MKAERAAQEEAERQQNAAAANAAIMEALGRITTYQAPLSHGGGAGFGPDGLPLPAGGGTSLDGGLITTVKTPQITVTNGSGSSGATGIKGPECSNSTFLIEGSHQCGKQCGLNAATWSREIAKCDCECMESKKAAWNSQHPGCEPLHYRTCVANPTNTSVDR